jgi:hypothetical protein
LAGCHFIFTNTHIPFYFFWPVTNL